MMTTYTFVFVTDLNFGQAIIRVQTFSTFGDPGTEELFTSQQLRSEYYFGFVEMGLVWPISAGFFFFAYAHNSLRDKFPNGVANILASLFYTFYLAFFFVIPDRGKLDQIVNNSGKTVGDLGFWMILLVFFIVLYISFSAFTETKSIVLPFVLNFVWNVGLTIFKASNSTFYDGYTPLMLIPYILSITILVIYGLRRRGVFSTIIEGLRDLRGFKDMPVLSAISLSFLFIFLSFFVPGLLEYVINQFTTGETSFQTVSIAVAFYYVMIIIFAIIVLTYEPTSVYDVLLISKDGRPISSHIELFQSDDVLISGFFTALTSVSAKIDSNSSEVRTISQGEREILIEDGVLTRLIALTDKDQPSIRNSIASKHREFEIQHNSEIENWTGIEMAAADKIVKEISSLEVKFNIPPQTRWIGTLSLIFAPLIIILMSYISQ